MINYNYYNYHAKLIIIYPLNYLDCSVQCGKLPDDHNTADWKTHPWFVLLRFQSRNNLVQHFTGTLVSDRYVVTAAEIFYSQDTAENRLNENNWKALPGANDFEDIDNFDFVSGDWTDILAIEINPLYNRAQNTEYVHVNQ